MQTLRTIVAISALAGLAIAGSASCLRSTTFQCESNTDCNGGTCELAEGGYCSFADSSCATTGRRFGEHSGPYANQCVGETTPIDGGPDGAPSDGPDGAPPGGCPVDYATLPNAGTNRYKVRAQTQRWTQQRDACAAEGAYLAIPNDAAELGALTTAGGAGVWLGINDITTEGTYVTSLNMPAVFLPWATGEPNNQGGQGGQDCVAGTGMTISDEACGDTRAAVCECVP